MQAIWIALTTLVLAAHAQAGTIGLNCHKLMAVNHYFHSRTKTPKPALATKILQASRKRAKRAPQE